MKQEKGKKKAKLLWLIAGAAALLIVIGVLLAVLLMPGQNASGASGVELYWNIDRVFYTENAEVEGLSMREPAADGKYYICFAYKGEQVELQIIDKQLVNYIDTMELMGLVFDDNGVVVDAVTPDQVATEYGRALYVSAVNGNDITLNSSQAMNGMTMEITLPSLDIVYNVDPKAEYVGAITELDIYDQLLIYTDEEENFTHVYITERAPNADVYWRVERCYDSAAGMTTREPDENGVYTIRFSRDGEYVDLKTKDVTLVNYVDSQAILNGMFAPVFDEEGYIVEFVSVAMVLRGKLVCTDYHITAIDGDNITATKLTSGAEQGRVVNFTMNDACKMYMCCTGCYEHCVGEKITDLQLNDRIYMYTDMENNPILLFVARRNVESPVYYNMERLYSNGASTREKDANGYYVFEMAAEGKVVTVRTKDQELATEIDYQSTSVMGLKLNGDIVERVYPLSCLGGSGDYGTNRYVTQLNGLIIKLMFYADFDNVADGILTPDCKIYDVTTGYYGVVPGEETTINPYDRITYIKNIDGQISTIFVTERYSGDYPLYYNLSRQYDSKTEQTTREPDAEGYYVFEMLSEGKAVTVKTKNKSLASFIDKQNAPFVALKVSGGIVKEAYPAASAVKYGYKIANYQYVDKVNKDGTFTTYWISNGEKNYSSYIYKMTDDCVVYNVSTGYDNTRGEKTTLKAGDQIQAFAVYPATWPDADITEIYVLNRKLDSPMYKNVKQMYNWTTKETTREPNADGWYVFDLAANGEIKQFKTQDREIATQVDSYDLGFTLVTDGDVIVRVCSPTLCKDVHTSDGSNHDVMSINGNKATLTRNQPNAAEDKYGNTVELTFAEDCVYYDYSPYAEKFGAETTLGLGDRVHCYLNAENEVIICFILYKNTHEAGYISYCEHCDQDVFWNPYTASIGTRDAHFYVTHDGAIAYQGVVGSSTAEKDAQPDVVLDLNGHTMTTTNRSFLVYGTLSIIDTVGGGGIAASNKNSGNGGCVMVTGDGVLNLYDGTLTADAGAKTGGVLYIGGGEATFNMYGGKVVGGHATESGGNIIIYGGKFNMSGGTISGGTADGSGGNILAGTKTTINISGGAIAGDMVVSAKCNVSLSGAPVITKGEITGMSLANEVLITLGKLSNKASVVVSANGTFTVENEKASEYKTYFHTEKDQDEILLQGNALYYVKAQKDLNAIDNSDLVFQTGTTKAVCPYCERTVTWTELTSGSTTLEPVGGTHYYLADNVTYDGPDWFIRAPYADSVVCVHLNGYNITATNGRVVQGYPGTLNIMGEGIVSGNYNHTASWGLTQGSVINTNTNVHYGTINLIGGTYVSPADNVQKSIVSVAGNGGTINMYAGATIESGTKEFSVHVGNSTLTDSTFGMYGGVINGGKVYITSPDAEAGYKSSFIMAGGTINSGVTLSANTTVTLSGAPVIGGSGLVIPQGLKLTLGALTQDADILVYASGVFTEVTDQAAEYEPLFRPIEDAADIVVSDNALRYTLPGALELDEDGNGYCEACGETVSWSVATNQLYKPTPDGHYYYKSADGSGVCSTPWQLITWADEWNAESTLCIHLNGQRVETGSRLYIEKGTLNIMGGGTLVGTGTTTTAALLTGTITMNGGKVNLYDGVIATDTTSAPAIYVGSSTATATLIKAQVQGGISVNYGVLELGGESCVTGSTDLDIIKVSASGKLVVKEDFTGSARVVFDSITSNPISQTNGVSEGAYTGTLTTVIDGTTYNVVDQNGSLYIDGYTYVDSGDDDQDDTNDGTLSLDADGYGYCEACKDTVKWSVATNQLYKPTPGGHYYYKSTDGSGICSTPYQLITWHDDWNAESTLCIHLNGQTVKTGSRLAMHTGNLNIMGSGTFMGTGTTTSLNLLTGTLSLDGGTVNLYGGTYTSEVDGVPAIKMNYSSVTVNLYGATVHGGIKVNNGVLNMGGASVVTGADGELTDNIYVSNAGKFKVKADYTGTASVKFEGYADNMIPALNGSCESTYTGMLYLEDGLGSQVLGEDGKLVVKSGIILNAERIAEEAETAIADGWCPVCEKDVTWTAVTSMVYQPTDGGHYYFNNASGTGVTNTPYRLFTWKTDMTDDYTVCLHLNGHRVETGSHAEVKIGTVNVMGEGSLVSTATATSTSLLTGTWTVNGGTLNLYGGTYLTEDATMDSPVIFVNNKDAEVNIFNDVMIGGEKGTVNGTNIKVTAGTVNMYGGTVRNGVGVYESNKYYGGNVYLNGTDSVMNVVAGTITGGTAGTSEAGGEGGNIYVKNAALTIYENAIVTGGTAVTNGGNIHASGGSITTEGSILSGTTTGSAAHGGNVSISGATLTINGGEITGGVAAGQGGNIRSWNGTITMTGGTAYGGESQAAMNDNIWLSGSSKMTMTGGTVKGTDGATTDYGTAISTSQTATLVLGGDAYVIRDDGVTVGNISISSTCSVKILNNWTGTASIRWSTTYLAGQTVNADNGSCGSISGGTFTAGGSFTGKLIHERGDFMPVTGVDGQLLISKVQPDNEDDVLKILGIGNSFTADSMTLLYEVYKAENPDKKIVIGMLNYGGCTLAKHVELLTNDTGAYYYQKMTENIHIKGGALETVNSVSMKTALLDEKWDIVSLQQASSSTPKPDSYNGDIGTIRDYVSQTLGYTPEFAWNFTWAYPDEGELLNAAITSTYGTSLGMYNQISAAVQQRIVNGEYSFDYLMPAGTAIQNARDCGLTAKDLYRDTLHLNNLGRLIASYTWYCELEGYDGEDKALTELKLTTVPSVLALTGYTSDGVTEIDDALEQIVIDAVNNALKNKFAVTTN